MAVESYANEVELSSAQPWISVVILNYNGERWLNRCLDSLRNQSIFDHIEVIVADNASPDGSAEIAAELMRNWSNGRVVEHGENLGYCEGNNRAAAHANGQYLLFLNNDTWLEPECLDHLLREVNRSGAAAATPLVLNYENDSFQSLGAGGFDCFGLPTSRRPHLQTRSVFMPEGCAYLIRRDVFKSIGEFDPKFFMFADETDLSWRIWIAGYTAVAVPTARMHHRGAANVNPEGDGRVFEFRTSDTKRYFANRNCLMTVCKNAQHVLLVLLFLQLALLFVEALVGWILVRRWSFVRRAYIHAARDCWRLRRHILEERLRIAIFRRRTDRWMIRFLRLEPNRWVELRRMAKWGVPRIGPE